jgi:hypothetical protein
MDRDHRLFAWTRRVALAGVVAVGVVAIVGSGGGFLSDVPPDCFSTTCGPTNPGPVITPAVSISPLKQTVQAGTSAAFMAQSVGVDQPRYQWRRSADGGANYFDIAGATASTYTLSQAQFADDGALFRVDMRGSLNNVVLASSNAVTLLVSSMPAVVFADGEFDPTDWSASAIADPAPNGPTHTEERSATGGLPGAFRRMVHTMTAGPSSLRVFNDKASAVYDPRVLGAIRAIDYAEDCNRISATTNTIDVASFAMFEQAGRRYVSANGRGCLSLWVNNFAQLPSLVVSDFRQADGPACSTGEACPDFSASAAPLQFGFARSVSRAASAPAASIEHGIDNWKISVWRP